MKTPKLIEPFSKRLIALVVAGTIASASANAASLIITPLGSPAAGLSAFQISADAGAGMTIGSVAGLNAVGVSQIWQNATFGGISPQAGDLTTAVAGNAAWEPWDTHWNGPNTTSANVLLSPGFGWAETNNGSNPAGLTLTPTNPAFAAFPGIAGLGSLSMTGAGAQVTIVAAARLQLQDILYLVLPAGLAPVIGAGGDITFDTIDNTNLLQSWSLAIIPEPSTFAMLLGAGGVLALVRRRRRA